MPYSLEDLYKLYQGTGNQGVAPVTDYVVDPQPPAPEIQHEDLAAPGETQAPSTVAGYFATQDTPEPQTPVSVSAKNGGGVGVGMSANGRGINFNTYGKMDQKDGPLEAKRQMRQAQTESFYAPVLGNLAGARQSGVDAANAMMAANQQKLTDEQASARVLEGIHKTQQDAEIASLTRETAVKNKMMADYQASLADFAASKVDPNDLWHGMSGGMRFGTMVSAFVHDFLGAKGIKTSAMDNLNNAIKRNIDAQIQNINKKGEVTRGFKTLYDMEASRSQSAAETRARINTYMLEAAKQHVVANMSQYKSLLATAEGKRALAELDGAYAKSYNEVMQHIDASSRARSAQDQQWEEHKAKMSMEAWGHSLQARANSLAERKFKDEIDQRKAKADAIREGMVLIDPADNVGKRILKSGLSDKEMQNTREVLINSDETNRALKEFRELTRNNEATIIDEAGTRRWTDEGRKLADAIRLRLAHSQVKANGERATDQDVADYVKMFPLDQVLSTGIEGMHTYAQKTTLQNANTYIRQYSKDLPQNEWVKGGDITYFDEDTREAGATYKQFKRGGPQADPVKNSMEAIASRDANARADKDVLKATGIDQTDADLDYGAAVKQNPNIGTKVTSGDALHRETKADEHAPNWAVGIQGLTNAAKNGDPGAMKTLTDLATKNFGDPANAANPMLKNMEVGDFYRVQAYARYKRLGLEGDKPQRWQPNGEPRVIKSPDEIYEENQ